MRWPTHLKSSSTLDLLTPFDFFGFAIKIFIGYFVSAFDHEDFP